MAEKRKDRRAEVPPEVTEVDIDAPPGALSLAVGRWGPYEVKGGKVRVPVDAIPAFQGSGYRIVGNDLGKAYAARRKYERDRRAGLFAEDDEPVEESPTTPPLADDVLVGIRERAEVETEAESREDK